MPSTFGPQACPFEARLAEVLIENAPLHAHLNHRLSVVISEAVANPGGMIRAELAYGVATVKGLPKRSCEAFACAVEYFHTASLMMDDLPAMDDSMERRGRICTHLLHGEGYAILGALALITKAYALIAEAIAPASSVNQLRAHRFVEGCLGTAGLINGQAQDLSGDAGTSSPRAAAVALGKTAPMIRLALGLPSILAGRITENDRTLKALSIYWGLLYQGTDDLIDAMLSVVKSGKTSGQDALLGRPTVIRQLGFSGAIRYLTRLLRLAEGRLALLFERNAAFHFLGGFQEAFRLRLAEASGGMPRPSEDGP